MTLVFVKPAARVRLDSAVLCVLSLALYFALFPSGVSPKYCSRAAKSSRESARDFWNDGKNARDMKFALGVTVAESFAGGGGLTDSRVR